MTSPPTTPEGRRFRIRRNLARLTIEQVAERAGITRDQYGAIERGRASGGRTEFHGADVHIARIAAALGVTPAELEADGQPAAADILRGGIPDLPAASASETAEADKLIEDFIGRHRDQELLRFMWGRTDSEGHLKPRAERVQEIRAWLQHSDAPAGRETG